ncbi:phosphoenolpyruvate--protein phosphotransferase, partial [Pseudomonas sp.]|uniref:phosphoenolpyruvate--protein phosphotransferase n=1 Tax=Pseudomonas sp. TaxID=306 RepID=UPI003CC691D7
MNNNNEVTLGAPLSGPVLALAQVPDPVFASGTLGEGIAIDPIDNCLVAPCAGEIIHLAHTLHAVTLRADNGAELLMHLGLDTVQLQGQGFTAQVQPGMRVSPGQPLLTFDMDQVAHRCTSLISLIVVTNGEHFCAERLAASHVNAGEPLLRIAARHGHAPRSVQVGEAVQGVAFVAHAGGLHARPAARLREIAKGFDCTAQLSYHGHLADIDSLMSVMALGVDEHAQVQVICRGPQREAALAALLQGLSTPIAGEQPIPVAVASTLSPLPALAAGLLAGICAAPGLASGPLVRLGSITLPADPGGHAPGEQQQALATALAAVTRSLEHTRAKARQRHDSTEEAIFAAHLALLHDPALNQAAEAAITKGSAASHAWSNAIDAQCQLLLDTGKPLLAERTNDLRDLGQQVVRELLGDCGRMPLPKGAIVVAREITPSDLLYLNSQGAAGLCMAAGGATSHVAILARAKALPCLVAMGEALLEQTLDGAVVLDADNGRLELTPDSHRLQQVSDQLAAHHARHQAQQAQAHAPAHTLDGTTIEVAANVAGAQDAALAHQAGADGVGLLRTEFLFADRHVAPDEEQQLAAYQAVLDAMGDNPVIIRTLDVGGDKQLDYLPLPPEANPALGLRGIRMARANPALFDQQLRALLRTRQPHRCRLLLPMVTEVDELLQIRQRLTELAGELGIDSPPQVGVMIEVPAAALLSAQLAEHADFLSIGTNDLSQYTLAMDRDHAGLAARVDALHPAVLALIAQACDGAHQHGRWVGVCGALASDPLATPVLIGLGVRELSV